MFRRSSFLAIALAFGVTLLPGCNSDETSGLDQNSAIAPSRDLLVASGPTLVTTSTTQGWQTASATIGVYGGKLSLGPHKLVVPAGAVLEPTVFTATIVPGNTIEVAFSARTAASGATVSRFPIPLVLSLNYQAAKIDNPFGLSIVYVAPDGTLQENASIIDVTNNQVVANVFHFSDYAVAMN